MNPQDIIDEFFIQDGAVMVNGSIKRSMLLAVSEDLKFSILLPGKIRPLHLTSEQQRTLRTMLPSFTVLSLFCTAVDLLARVVTRQHTPPPGQNGRVFRNCARAWFGLSVREAHQLWLLRNSISHHYALNDRQTIIEFGSGNLVQENGVDHWEFYLHAMYTSLIRNSRRIYDHLSAQYVVNKQLTADYLTDHGFIYTRPR